MATIVLYYQFYLAGAVATRILADYHMSFVYYVNISVVGYLFGAVASFATGVADRYGRANIVTVGLFVVALLCLFGIPAAGSSLAFGVIFVVIGTVEGVILVATPALIRDFSPQLGRASAMGFWTLGPVVGSLVVSIQVSSSSNTYPWQDHYRISGVVGLVVAILALLLLRELAPALRDQVMVSAQDRALIEARAKGIDVAASLKHPFRQMLKPDIILSSFAISVFLIIYYIAVGFFPIFFETVFGFTQSQANTLGDWMWAFDAGALLVVGVISDKVGVRKPFMLVGAICTIIMTIIFLSKATQPDTSFTAFVWILSLLAISLGIAYAPWMASFTETAEQRNPALAATGLAVWGLTIRIVIALSVFFLPFVVNSVTPLVEKGPTVQAIAAGKDPGLNAAQNSTVAAVAKDPSIVPKVQRLAAQDAAQLKTAAAIQPATLAKLQADPTNQQVAAQAVGQIAGKFGIGAAAAQARLVALSKIPAADLKFLSTYGPPLQDPKVQGALKYLQANAPSVQKAAADAPKQWRTYFWVAVGGEVVFIPLIWMLTGGWDPRVAKREAAEHEAWVREQLDQLGGPAPEA
ncbi:MFS transporter [Leekyejoonella antrihumi]|uniref:MFS transporter n=1 Tax=Leekyejoonella antrihumi TaxID=1660198 RepID=A0A563DWB9_9MICO|nr:MFS transporter [Leekyejoonella antrihumi]